MKSKRTSPENGICHWDGIGSVVRERTTATMPEGRGYSEQRLGAERR